MIRNNLKAEAVEKCKSFFTAFGDCATREGILVVFKCRGENKECKCSNNILLCVNDVWLVLFACVFAFVFACPVSEFCRLMWLTLSVYNDTVICPVSNCLESYYTEEIFQKYLTEHGLKVDLKARK